MLHNSVGSILWCQKMYLLARFSAVLVFLICLRLGCVPSCRAFLGWICIHIVLEPWTHLFSDLRIVFCIYQLFLAPRISEMCTYGTQKLNMYFYYKRIRLQLKLQELTPFSMYFPNWIHISAFIYRMFHYLSSLFYIFMIN